MLLHGLFGGEEGNLWSYPDRQASVTIDKKSETDIDEYLQRHDIKTLKDSALELFGNGETSLEEILPVISEAV